MLNANSIITNSKSRTLFAHRNFDNEIYYVTPFTPFKIHKVGEQVLMYVGNKRFIGEVRESYSMSRDDFCTAKNAVLYNNSFAPTTLLKESTILKCNMWKFSNVFYILKIKILKEEIYED
jgi:hypothetical protein